MVPFAEPAVRRAVVPVLLGLVTIGLVITSVVVLAGRGPRIEQGMVVVARQEALNFFTLDPDHADKQAAAVLALATGTFKDEYAKHTQELVSQIRSKKVRSTAAIPEDGVAVEFAGPGRGQVLVTVDMTRTRGASTEDVRNRARIVLREVQGRWLVSDVNQVG